MQCANVTGTRRLTMVSLAHNDQVCGPMRHRGMWPVSADDDNTGATPWPGSRYVTRHMMSRDIWHHTWCSWPAAPGCQWGGSGQFPNLLISQSYQSLNQLMRATPKRGRVGDIRTNCDIACGLHLYKVWEINHMSSYTTQLVFLLSIPSTWY